MELDRLALERDAHVLVCPRCDNDYLHQTAAPVELGSGDAVDERPRLLLDARQMLIR